VSRRYSVSDLLALTGNLGAVLPAPKRRKNDEWRLQFEAFQWWRGMDFGVPRHLFFHIPNGSVLGGTKDERALKGKMLKLTGMESGVVDCFMSVPRSQFHGCYIEFKSPIGVLSPEQKQFLRDVEIQGYYTAVVRGLEEFKAVVLRYLIP
jgi:hypothetical protein